MVAIKRANEVQNLHIKSLEPTNSLSNAPGFRLSVQSLYIHTGFSAV